MYSFRWSIGWSQQIEVKWIKVEWICSQLTEQSGWKVGKFEVKAAWSPNLHKYAQHSSTLAEKCECSSSVLVIHFRYSFSQWTLFKVSKTCSKVSHSTMAVKSKPVLDASCIRKASISCTEYEVLHALHHFTPPLDCTLLYGQEWIRNRSRIGHWIRSRQCPTILRGNSAKMISRMMHMSVTSVHWKFGASCTKTVRGKRQTCVTHFDKKWM